MSEHTDYNGLPGSFSYPDYLALDYV